MIWRAWIVLSILWCTFWMGMYVTLGPLTIRERLALRAELTLVTALPWIAGLGDPQNRNRPLELVRA